MDIKNTNNSTEPDKQPEKVTGVWFYIRQGFAWLWGISSFIVALGIAVEGKLAFLPILFFAILITPLFSKKIEKIINIKNYGFIKGISCTILYFLFISMSSSVVLPHNSQTQNIHTGNPAGIVILSILCIIFIILSMKFYSANRNLKQKYAPIIDIEQEIESRKKDDDERHDKLKKELQSVIKQINDLKGDYSQKREIYNELLKRKRLLEEDDEMMVVGLYKPHFNFDDSSAYKDAMTKNYEKQKKIIKDKKAIVCHTEWTVEGSRVKGRQMIDRNIKLMLKAFNGECDSIISKTKWNNIDKMEARIQKAFEDINKLGEPNYTSIQNYYLKLKFEELYLTHEYEVKKQEEKEEQKRIQAQIREEQKAQKELEAAKLKAEKEEADFQKALQKAHEQLAQANAEERAKYEEEIAQLQQELKEAEERKQRAISQAQLTKCGHIYVISNIGSFGENIYKIGMTRRLDPMERVNELGDASVPFKFDVHAMIFSEDAPALESKLHEVFKDKSVNLVNMKKEFFRVSLEEIEKVVKENYGEIEFTKIAEARDYRETLAILKAKERVENFESNLQIAEQVDFPTEL